MPNNDDDDDVLQAGGMRDVNMINRLTLLFSGVSYYFNCP